jgi:hypothetical protein
LDFEYQKDSRMRTARILYHLARADFLERVRRYSFLITLGLTIYYAYICVPPNHAPYVTLQIAGHRGVYGSAYIGSLMAMQTAMILSLLGFYLVKNTVDRDLQTGVGQILAATSLTRPLYTVGKALSNFAVLMVMVAVMAVAAGFMQLARHEDMSIHPWQLVAPFLFIVMPVMAGVAGVAILFEAIPWLRGGLGNVAYFFLWTALGAGAQTNALAGNDPLGFGVIIPGIRAACGAAFPGCAASQNFSMGFNFAGGKVWDLTTFRWDGMHWTLGIVLRRLIWFGLGFGMALLAAIFFHRFDLARESRKKAPAAASESPEPEASAAQPAHHMTLSILPAGARRFRFGAMVRAELRLALKGFSRWWYIVAALLMAGGLVSPVRISRFWLIAAWIWPILIWSAMGTREARQRTGQLIFSTAHPLARQLPACWLAGVIVALMTGGGSALRLVLAGDGSGLAAWMVGALFIPTLALALGVWSGSSKLFEVIYTLLWYVGPANQVAQLDYMGATGATSPLVFLTGTLLLGGFALVGRRRQIRM